MKTLRTAPPTATTSAHAASRPRTPSYRTRARLLLGGRATLAVTVTALAATLSGPALAASQIHDGHTHGAEDAAPQAQTAPQAPTAPQAQPAPQAQTATPPAPSVTQPSPAVAYAPVATAPDQQAAEGPIAPPATQAQPLPDTIQTRQMYYADRRRARAMTASGFSLFGASYLLSAFFGSIILEAKDVSYAEVYLIPVAGPFAALPAIETSYGRFFTIMGGLAQTGGLALGIVGAVKLSRANRNLRRYDLSVAPMPGGARLSLRF